MWTKVIVATVLGFCLCATQDVLAACVNCEIVKKPPFDVLLGKGPPKTFPLVCRGGDSTDGISFGFKAATKTLSITFQAGTQPAEQGLKPGQCSWRDRGFRPGEPEVLCHHNLGQFTIQWSDAPQGTIAIVQPDSPDFSRALPVLAAIDMRKSDCFAFFDVFNEGQCMNVVNARPAGQSCQ